MLLQAEESSGLTGYADRPMRKQYKLFFGVLAQFCYVGAQVSYRSLHLHLWLQLTSTRWASLRTLSTTVSRPRVLLLPKEAIATPSARASLPLDDLPQLES